ncbi:Maintenance of telomere capping protein 1 [Psilocybe cubensis]|uniref:Maintenance of telomere capping protein 1 n=2 Tax=Psilocybe cubensis TaxID=181762 RepID=A0ACB8HHG8_PSICU|nr:Maintenance of telomere capping protein 1 [Psilocybe cubensis]KAH9487122.1 Maintenance of telomere capping protein 1 [Psilocybe cubensis]
MASKKSKQEEALKFLDDLDSFAPPPEVASADNGSQPAAGAPGSGNEGEAAEVLAFLDEITQKSTEPTRATTAHISRSGTPTLRKSTERVRLGGGSSLLPSASSSTSSLNRTASSDAQRAREKSESTTSVQSQAQASSGGWGWGSVWSSASAAIQQAKTVVDEQVKHLPKNEQARKWGEGVIEYAKTAQLDKLGQDFKRVGLSTLTDILNVVAPPISEHEVIQVWLSHDMQGYEGIEPLAYRALARILEQVEGGDLVVNRGNESRPKEGSEGRDLNTVDGYEAALKLAQVNIEDVIKKNDKATSTTKNSANATTYSHVYLRIQPFFSTLSQPPTKSETKQEPSQYLQFLIYLDDPEHKLTHVTVTQAVPSKWIALWDEYDWVEDLIADSLRIGVEVIGQEYVVERMGWASKADSLNEEPASTDSTEDKAEGSTIAV